MKKAMLVMFLISATCQASPSNKHEAHLSLDSPGGATTNYFLRQDPKLGTLCSSKAIPSHKINVPELKTLKAPFKNEDLSKKEDCQLKIVWRHNYVTTEACYDRGKERVIEKIMRWCSSL